MTKPDVFRDACRDIDENLWVLSDKPRARIVHWFLAIQQDAYQRGLEDGKTSVSERAS